MSKVRVSQFLDIDTDAEGFLTSQVLNIEAVSGAKERRRLDYRMVVQEILAVGMRAFKQNCINAVYQHFGNQRLAAEALGMQKTYISRVINQRKRRLQDEKQKLIGDNGNGGDVVDIIPGAGS